MSTEVIAESAVVSARVLVWLALLVGWAAPAVAGPAKADAKRFWPLIREFGIKAQ
jgi:hypothetical protein